MSIWEQLRDIFIGQSTPIRFKDEWIDILQVHLPLYRQLPSDLQSRLHKKTAQFIATTYFEGCGGLELDDAMILSIAAQACVLVLGYDGVPYPNLNTVLIYPSAFETTNQYDGPGGTIIEETVEALGESWDSGTVILAWDSVQEDATHITDGHNVTFHEFAHQLDAMDGETDGVPLLPSEEAYQTWANVLGAHCNDLIRKVEDGEPTLLDDYATSSPEEFFAVATETFFEMPKQLAAERPELYATLRQFYNLDPKSWF